MPAATTNDRNQLILRYPSSSWGNLWREALPSGNGKIGAAVYGGIHQETVMIQHEALWHGGRRVPLPDVGYTLPEVRKRMSEGEYEAANSLLSDELKEKGYEARLAAPLPLADLKLTMGCRNGFRHYRRHLNMETGEVTVGWKDGETVYERALFVSRADDMIVYEIRSDQRQIDARFRIVLHETESRTGPPIEVKQSMEAKAEDTYLFYAATNDDGTDFGVVARLIPSGGEVAEEDGAIAVKQAERVLVLLKVFVKGDRQLQWPCLKEELSRETRSYSELLEPHVKLHGRLFHSVSIALTEGEDARSNEELLLEAYEGQTPTRLIEKMWAYGRYLFISATAAEGYPCAMYGLWGGDYRAIWCHYMANENIQMIYWHAPSGGLAELMPGLFDYYDRLMDDFRENARKLFGCRGIYVPAGSTPGMGLPNQIVSVIMNWTGAAGWLARHYYDYYLYTGDIEFLRKKALPFMREAALFYEDFLVPGDDGHYLIYPSVSPENSPGNFVPKEYRALNHPMPTAINATMDFAIAKELLHNLIEGSRSADVFTDEVEKWEAMIERIPPYEVNRDGAVREWMHPEFDDNDNHRHISHLYPVFPGQEIMEEDHPELFRAFATAVSRRMTVGLSDQTGWSLAHLANIYARLGDGERALECLELLSRSCLLNNFYTLHNDWRNMGVCLTFGKAPFQIDANMGWVSAVQEMLMYASRTMIRLLPAVPARWNKGSVKGLRCHTGTISMSWDTERRMFTAQLQAERDTQVTVKPPKLFGNHSFTGDNVEVSPSPYGGNCKIVKLRSGDRLIISAEPKAGR